MTDKSRIHPAVAEKLFFEWEDHQGFGDVFPEQPNSSLTPRPKLWAHVIHHRNAPFVHLPGNAPIESGRVDDNGQFGTTPVTFSKSATEAP